ncbi:MAG TPA: extracellular solute-binding protein [Symbiobacteriaceae bacterium]|nr:extracellular solute-binding protein [Symbiobacteriaceae bacterium]
MSLFHWNGKTRSRRATVILLLLVSALLAAAGCARPPEPPKPAYKGKLVLWAAPGLAGSPVAKPTGAFFEEQAKAFTAKHSDITVDVKLFASPDALEDALLTGAESPDLVFSRFLPQAASRLANVEPVLGQTAVAEYLPNAVDAFRTPGQLLGLPALLDLQVLALNEQRFTAAGVPLPANGKWTSAELENSLSRLSGNGTFGLGFYQVPGYHEWWPFVSGLLSPEGTVAAGAEEGFARLVRYRKDGLLHPDTAKLKAEETWALFARGEFAVMPVAAWAIPLLQGSDYHMKISVAGFPGDMTVGYTYGYMLFRQDQDLKLQAAVSLARFLGSDENQSRLAAETGLMPALKAAPNPFANDPALTRAFALAATQRALPAGPAWAKAEAAAARDLTLALLGAREPKAAAAAIQTALQTAIAPAAK